MTVTESERRKRKRPSNSSESGDDGRKRGRPRVEKPDASAADRRRTQIRMAQRAYRQRKESTLEELRQRVSILTNTIELMGRAFVDCRDRLVAKGLSESQLHDVRETCVQFDNLKATARNPEEDCEAITAAGEDEPQSDTRLAGRSTFINSQARNVPSWLDHSALNPPISTIGSGDGPLGYLYFSEEFGDIQSMTRPNVTTETLRKMRPETPAAINNSTQQRPPILPAPLSPTVTYSFQESTFGRRLHRASMESAYQMLVNPNGRQEKFERAFKLALLRKPRPQIIESVKTLLRRGPHEDLDMWTAPLLHIGGAGTHYPRRDQFGNLRPRKEPQDLGLIGQQAFPILEKAVEEQFKKDVTVRIAGYDGEWFDPYDVEGYLEERGIHIDPLSSFTEAEIIEPTPSLSSVSSMSTETEVYELDASNNLNTARPFATERSNALSDTNNLQMDWSQGTNHSNTNVGFSDVLTGSWLNFSQPDGNPGHHWENRTQSSWPTNEELAMMQNATLDGLIYADTLQFQTSNSDANGTVQSTSPRPRKKSVIIDVAKFIKLLTMSSICIGRTPGFRKQDVDQALAIASFDVE